MADFDSWSQLKRFMQIKAKAKPTFFAALFVYLFIHSFIVCPGSLDLFNSSSREHLTPSPIAAQISMHTSIFYFLPLFAFHWPLPPLWPYTNNNNMCVYWSLERCELLFLFGLWAKSSTHSNVTNSNWLTDNASHCNQANVAWQTLRISSSLADVLQHWQQHMICASTSRHWLTKSYRWATLPQFQQFCNTDFSYISSSAAPWSSFLA